MTPEPTPPSAIEAHRIVFSGAGGEFFRVWIVNLLLTVVTLGFYTPFARKRKAQYFYSHTFVAGSPLEFTAQQRTMVVGFLLLLAVFGVYNLAAETGHDTIVLALLLAGAALAPYLWASAMRFRLGSTRWRGIRLQFVASWRQVYLASWPLFAAALVWAAVALALGTLIAVAADAAPVPRSQAFPLWGAALVLAALAATLALVIRLEYNYKSLLVRSARVGAQAGRWKPVYGDFVKIWVATLGVLLLGAVPGGALFFMMSIGAVMVNFSGLKSPGILGAMLGIVASAVFSLLAFFLASAPARAYREARMFQLVWGNVGVSSISRFQCELKVWPYVMLRVKNMALVLFTLGFYRPFAQISEYRMKAQSVTLHVRGGVDQLVGQLVEQQGGLGDAVADAVGLDLIG